VKNRLHKIVHRVAGSTVALVGILTTFQAVNLEPLLGPHAAAKALTGAGLLICALELLPIVDGWLEA